MTPIRETPIRDTREDTARWLIHFETSPEQTVDHRTFPLMMRRQTNLCCGRSDESE